MVRWCDGAMVRWCDGAMVRWCGGTPSLDSAAAIDVFSLSRLGVVRVVRVAVTQAPLLQCVTTKSPSTQRSRSLVAASYRLVNKCVFSERRTVSIEHPASSAATFRLIHFPMATQYCVRSEPHPYRSTSNGSPRRSDVEGQSEGTRKPRKPSSRLGFRIQFLGRWWRG
jgi:hypothetical protein